MTNDAYPGIVTAEDLTTVVLGGGKGMKLHGKSYSFGEGSGSYVKINLDNGPSEHKMAGTQGNEVIDPEFIGTLGHELGHAMKMKAGALAPNQDSSVLAGLEPDQDERTLWSNRAEEFININAVENKLRDEHGVPNRKYHKPLGSVHAADRKKQLMNEYGRLAVETVNAADIPAYAQALTLFGANLTALSDINEFDRRWQVLQNLGPSLSVAGVREWKTAQVNEQLRNYQTAISDAKLVDHFAGWRQVKRFLAVHKATINTPNNGDLRDFKRMVRDLIQAVPAERKAAAKSLARAERARKAEVKKLMAAQKNG